MKLKQSLPAAVALVAGLATVTIGSLPAEAGDTNRVRGCAAHWRTTATWNECVRDSQQPVEVRLAVDCDLQLDWTGKWKRVEGAVDPLDSYSCFKKANSAWNGYR
ncbi:hypothetical protein ACGFIK_04050 [Micromonospora sp. NPDC048871]|uniref:hypothetical protein n=1 Tax=unclassified Micromonospora TaxID=2617518 RepID=UPI002E13E2B4|nr:hypothetical protein OIE53_17875 [Micromonospora sp. NBC_01739]